MVQSQSMAAPRFRQRKVPVKQSFSVLREKDFEATFDDDTRQNVPSVVTGVDEKEEIEFHLQAIISRQAVATDKAAYIPTPPTNLSGLQHERLYAANYRHPYSYIRFSSTVEDCAGAPYCLDTSDEVFLHTLVPSASKSPTKRSAPCSEEQFELAMSFFEEISATKQPLSAVDNAPAMTYQEMEACFDETIDDAARSWGKEIYEYWKARRVAKLNQPLMPTLKVERNVETDDADPYVCFRRREVRQARKTRARDAQVTEKLRKLRQELEQARQLLHLTKQREVCRRDQVTLDRQIFDYRFAVKEVKRNLRIKDNDIDLVNQRPIEKIPKSETPHIRTPRPAGNAVKEPSDSTLHYLSDDRAKREKEVKDFIADSMNKHKLWNAVHVDNSWRPITPPLENSVRNAFREAVTEFAPTTSLGADGALKNKYDHVPAFSQNQHSLPFRYASPPIERAAPVASFRRRVGRGGRLWIDRRVTTRKAVNSSEESGPRSYTQADDRAAFDNSDDELDMWIADPYDQFHLKHRVEFALNSVHQSQLLAEQSQRSKIQQDQLRLRQSAVPSGLAANSSPALPRMALAR